MNARTSKAAGKIETLVAPLRGKKFLVAGGCGFMGSNFIRTLLERIPDARAVNLDLLTYAGNEENLAGVDESRYAFVKGDICDGALAHKLMRGADFVVNFAAETHVDRSIHASSEQFTRTNVLGVHSLLEALRASPQVEKMIHVSTDEVWGDLPLDSKEQFNESSPLRPSSPYAASKAGGDLLAQAYVRTYAAPVIVTHSVNNFGPRQYPEKLIPFFTARAARDMPLPLYGDGKNMRDWIHVDDHSSALLSVLAAGAAGEAYNISSGTLYANIDIAGRILEALGKPRSLITFVEDRPGHDLKYAVDSSKLRALGWTPRLSLEEKLPETVRWYAEHLPKTAPSANAHIAI